MRWWVLLHVATAFWFIAGLAGRDVVMSRARVATDMTTLRTLTATAGVFDRAFVIPGSFAVLIAGLIAMFAEHLSLGDNGWLLTALILYLLLIPLVPLVFLPRGKVFEAAVTEAPEAGPVTAAVRAALDDRAVLAARWFERIVVAAIVVLMVTKPF
jgi:Predicted integral membrane protein (DUF2269)